MLYCRVSPLAIEICGASLLNVEYFIVARIFSHAMVILLLLHNRESHQEKECHTVDEAASEREMLSM